MITFQQAGLKYESDRRTYIETNLVKLEKVQLNMYVPKVLVGKLKADVQAHREQFESDYYASERKRLTREFEAVNSAPHSKDY